MIVFRNIGEARLQLHQEIPNLANAHWRIKSPLDTGYQCIAWAACRTDRVWWPWNHPQFYWPPGLTRLPYGAPVPVDHFAEMFQKKLGYRCCDTPDFEVGYQKIAIYSNALGVTHMARQHLFGRGWLSKLGSLEDILHKRTDDVAGDIDPMANQYGTVALYMKRSWGIALLKLCLFRCALQAMKHGLYRILIPSLFA